MRHQLEQANKSLHGRLEETMNASKTREEELKELKRKLQRLDNAKKKSALTNQSAHSGSTQLRYAAEGNDHGSVSNLSHGRHASHSNFQISVGSGATGEDGVATAKRALVGSPASSFTENTRDTLKLPGLKVTKRSSDASFASSTPDLTIMRKSRVPSFVVSHQPERRRTTTQLLPLTGDQLLRGPTTLKVFLDLILFREFQEFVNLTQHTTQPSSALTTVSTIGHLLQTTSGNSVSQTMLDRRCATMSCPYGRHKRDEKIIWMASSQTADRCRIGRELLHTTCYAQTHFSDSIILSGYQMSCLWFYQGV